MKLIFSFFCLFFCLNGFSQAQNNQEKIKTLLDTYFLDDREIIHVQFNKNIYLNNEDIAFKGYVFSKNNNTPYLNTSNIQLTIYNEKEEVVQKQLLFTANGMFSGGIHLNKNFKKGKYLFHFYSNWMNNFKEDDSFSQTIEINEIDEPVNIKIKEPNLKTAKIAFFPEGGAIIDGISNTIGVKITDCNNRGLELNNILIFDSKSNEVSHFNTNKMGNGVLYLTADIDEKYTLKTQSNGQIITQDLPAANQTGIAISYNNNLPNNKLAISVRTNEKGVELHQNKKLNLLIQQNGYSVLKEINFDNQQKDQVVFVDKKYLQNGVNSIRLIDENLNEITERLIYNYAIVQPVVNLIAKVSNDNIILSGITNLAKGDLSTSILPEKNIGFDSKRCILGTYYLNTYLENPEIDNFAYFDPENKYSKRDMDYLMQVQTRSKLRWENIKSNPPILNYKFNKGITISGKIEGRINPNANKTVSLISLKNNVFENIKLEKDNTFKLENYFVQDSTVYVLQLENEKNAAVFSKIVAQVSDNQTKFNLPIRFNLTKCPFEKMAGESIVFSASKLDKNTIDLEEVLIKQKKKEVLTHSKGISINSIAHKIDDREFGTVLDFIGRNGFRTGVNPTTYDAFINSSRDAFAGGSPEVFVDGVFLFDFNLLFDLDIDTVDEVYIDKSGLGSARLNSSGTIRIFLKRGKENKFYISKCSTLIATSGFTKSIAFKNAAFTTQKEFDLLGTLNWSPNIALKENQNFEIKFPKSNQTMIEVLIEGFSDDGQLISEIKKIPVETL
jgi:hypothetical protein